jgi:hypothetical protein
MLFVEYESLAKEIHRDRLNRAEQTRQLQMLKTNSVPILKNLTLRLGLWWTGTPKTAVIKASWAQ